MNRHQLLRNLHTLLQPRTYLEIGVSTGSSMTLSRTPSIGIDPFFQVRSEILCDLHLARTSSDEFFARKNPLAHFDEPVIDLAFIDGMHLAEYVLRDFINVERYTRPASVVVFDDMLPRHVDEAGREREAGARRGAWTGDVYKALETIRSLRPDLICLEVDTKPTGTAVVLLPDHTSQVLFEAHDSIVPTYVVEDPQDVPPVVLERSRAISAETLINAPIWDALVAARDLEPDRSRTRLRKLLGHELDLGRANEVRSR